MKKYIFGAMGYLLFSLILFLSLFTLKSILQLISGIFPMIFLAGIIFSIYLRIKHNNGLKDKSMLYLMVVGTAFLGWILCILFEENLKLSLGSNFVKGFEIQYKKEATINGSIETTITTIPTETFFGEVISNIGYWIFGLFLFSVITCISIIKSIPPIEEIT